MNEGNLVINTLHELGKEANVTFERRLKSAAPPLETLLECGNEADDVQECITAMQRSFSQSTNPWGTKETEFEELAQPYELTVDELDLVPENPWVRERRAEQIHRAAADDDEPEPEVHVELPVDVVPTPRFARNVERMKARIEWGMTQDNLSKAEVVNELLTVHEADGYAISAESRRIIESAAELVTE